MTERPYTLGLYLLRCYEAGIRLEDMCVLEYGDVMDILIERGNDNCEYAELASQEDMDRF